MAEERARYLLEFRDIPTPRQAIPELTVEQRQGNFDQVELGFAQEQAIAEAKRCLSCRRCLGCALCLAECHTQAIEFEQAEETLELEVDSVILAPTVERFPAPVKEDLLFGKHPNVVSSLQFERLLSDDGPYGGLVLRPGDGEIPQRIAFLLRSDQGVDSSLAVTARLAAAAKAKIEGLVVGLYVPDAVQQAEIDQYLGADLAASVKKTKAMQLKDVEGNGNLGVDDGDKGKGEEFDMVVLLSSLALPPHIKELHKKIGLESMGRGFWETEDTDLAETSVPGVFVTGHAFAD